MVSYHHMFLILKYFEVYLNLNEIVSPKTSPNLIWAVAIYPNIYNMQILMNLFYFTQIFPIVPKFEQNCLNHPNLIEFVEIYPNDSNFINLIKAFIVHLHVYKCNSMELSI